MKRHTQNLYEITNFADLDFSYRLVEFDLTLIAGKEDLYNRQLNKIAEKVSTISGGPAAIIYRNGKSCIAIPADRQICETKIDVAPFAVTVKMDETVYRMNASQFSERDLILVEKFLDFEIRKQLSANKDLWKLSGNRFYRKSPVRFEHATIDIYTGFVFKLVMLSNNKLYICLDLSTKYIEKAFLSEHVNLDNAALLAGRYRKRRVLYMNADRWYQAEIAGFGIRIDTHEFSLEGKTHSVYDYVTQQNRAGRSTTAPVIRPDDVTLLYTYPGRAMEPHSGAVSMAKMIYNTNDREVKELHKQSIKDPSRRFEAIGTIINRNFNRLSFNGISLSISTKPLEERAMQFDLPALRFNQQVGLNVAPKGGNALLRDFAMLRKRNVVDHGILSQNRFDQQFLIVPNYLDRDLVASFKKNMEWQLGKLAPGFPGFKIVVYKVLTGQSATAQNQEIEKALIRHNALSGFGVFILPDLSFDSRKQIKHFHDCLKNKFYPKLKLQCASALKVRNFFESFPSIDSDSLKEFKVPTEKQGRFRSYIFNLGLEYLLVNRKWPYALGTDPHYDIYIGVDVHDRHAGFTFFFKKGENLFFVPVRVPQKNWSQRAEKLQSPLLISVIYERLKKYIPLYAPNPNGIVLLRDGRSFGEEQKALETVVRSLTNDKLVDPTILRFGVVDLHKQSATPLRMASPNNSFNKLENPAVGTYRLIGNSDGFLFNTGYPFQTPGSAKPLHLSLRAGNLDFLKVLEDVFAQSILAFSAPDRPNSLPITIKLIDTLLEPLSGALSQSEEDQEYEEVISNEV